MFPLKANEPYILDTGKRSTLGEQFAQTEGDISELKHDVDELSEALTDLEDYVTENNVKNKLPYDLAYIKSVNTGGSWSGNTKTVNGTTWIYGKNSVTLSGVPSVNVSEIFAKTTLPAGKYILSGCPSGGSVTTYDIWIGVRNAGDSAWISSYKDLGDGITFDVPADASYVRIELEARTGFDGSTKVFKPMIRDASITDPTYQPYAPTNLQLENNKANKSDLASISITGTTNSTGATIASGTYFYLNGSLVRAKTSIANGATLTANTNYEAVTVGGLNELNKELTDAIGQFKFARIEGNAPSSISSYEDYTLYNVAGITCKWFTILSAEKYNVANDIWYELPVDVYASEYVGKASVDNAGNFRVKFTDITNYNKFRAVIMYY